MPFELTVATRQGPRDTHGPDTRPNPSRATLVLSGLLSSGSTEAILAAIRQVTTDGVASIVVEFDTACVADTAELESFVAEIMALRKADVEVQVVARDDALQQKMSALPNARDWLLTRESDASSTARRSLHVDGSW